MWRKFGECWTAESTRGRLNRPYPKHDSFAFLCFLAFRADLEGPHAVCCFRASAKIRARPKGQFSASQLFPRSLPAVFARATIEIVCKRDSAVFPCLIWTGGANHHFVMGEVKLQRGAPGIEDFAFIV